MYTYPKNCWCESSWLDEYISTGEKVAGEWKEGEEKKLVDSFQDSLNPLQIPVHNILGSLPSGS
jgi:hypothetical protein